MRSTLRSIAPGHAVRSANIAGSVYGLILTASVIASTSEARGNIAGRVAAFTAMTLVIFWAAHSYAQTLGGWVDGRAAPTLATVWEVMRREWAMVSAGVPPLLVLLAGGVIPSSTDRPAINIALGLVLVELTLACGYAAHRAGASMRGRLVATAIGIGMATVVILLKILVH